MRRPVLIALTILVLGYPMLVIAEYKYMEYRYNGVTGDIDDIRDSLRFFNETPTEIAELVPGYLSEDIFEEEGFGEFQALKFTTPFGGYFHVIFDEKGLMWDKVPSGFADLF